MGRMEFPFLKLGRRTKSLRNPDLQINVSKLEFQFSGHQAPYECIRVKQW